LTCCPLHAKRRLGSGTSHQGTGRCEPSPNSPVHPKQRYAGQFCCGFTSGNWWLCERIDGFIWIAATWIGESKPTRSESESCRNAAATFGLGWLLINSDAGEYNGLLVGELGDQ
jgi:hypothetical protein